LLLVGDPHAGEAGSWLQLHYGGVGGSPCVFNGPLGLAVLRQVESWLAAGRVLSCHDLSDGGLAVAAAEMAMGAGSEGLELDLGEIGKRVRSPVTTLLFGEAPHRFLIEVAASDAAEMCGQSAVPVQRVGIVTDTPTFSVTRAGKTLLSADLASLRRIWRHAFTSVWPEAS
jgi:phosphoribosylformylglycinamidine synthase